MNLKKLMGRKIKDGMDSNLIKAVESAYNNDYEKYVSLSNDLIKAIKGIYGNDYEKYVSLSNDLYQITIHPECGYYSFSIDYYRDSKAMFIPDTFYENLKDVLLTQDEFLDCLSELKANGNIMTDSLARRMNLPCYGEIGYDFTCGNWNDGTKGGVISEIENGIVYIDNVIIDELFKVPVDEFDEYFEKTTGISPDLIKR